MKRSPIARKSPLRGKARSAKRKTTPMGRCDHLAREICRARGRCEGRPGHECAGSLQWAHIIRRGHSRWLRHDEDNCLYLCAREHMYFTGNDPAWIAFIGEDRYLNLVRRANEGLGRKIDWVARERMLIERLNQVREAGHV